MANMANMANNVIESMEKGGTIANMAKATDIIMWKITCSFERSSHP